MFGSITADIVENEGCVDVLSQEITEEEIFFIVKVSSSSSICPSCLTIATRKHSQYSRHIDDLPAFCRQVHFLLINNKWFCDNPQCDSKVFSERLSWIRPYKRKTQRLEELLDRIAFSSNCITAVKICKALGIPVSHDTLLRHVKDFTPETAIPSSSIALDDFAFKKKTSYGTILIDLESRIPLDLLPTRLCEDVTQWLKRHPHIQLVCRDGSKTYAKAISAASEKIIQVADRWHILHQLFEQVKKEVYSILPSKWIPALSGATNDKKNNTEINNAIRKTDFGRIEKEEKKWEVIQEVHKLKKQGYKIASIARKFHLSRGTVYSYLKIQGKPNQRRSSPFDRFRPTISSLIKDGKKAVEIERECRAKGFQGATSTLNRFIAEERRQINHLETKPLMLRRKIINIIWNFKKDNHSTDFLDLHPTFHEAFPNILKIDHLVSSFRNLFTEGKNGYLEEWINRWSNESFPFINSFINGLKEDKDAIQESIRETWSNGVTEGHVNRLKNIKRMMYGRAGFHLLRNRILYRW